MTLLKWLAGPWLGAGLLLSPASGGDAYIRLTDRQVEAGRFNVTAAGPGAIGRSISVPGAIVPSGDHIARVAVRLLGTVAELRKRLGDAVTAGEVVAVIESREVADAKSEYLAASLNFELQQTLFARSRGLFEGKAVSENDFLRARSAFEEVRIKREAARQKLFALNLSAAQIETLPQEPPENLRRQELRAPISGRIAERHTDVGALVGRDGQASEIYVIVDLSTVWAELAVATADLPAIREGQTITVADARGVASQATVIFVSPLLDKDTRLARVVAAIDNAAQAWRPGAFVTASIPVDRGGADLVIPRSALQTHEGHDVAFVRTNNGFAARRLTLGRRDADHVAVTSGLAAGERIATQNSFVLKAELGKSAEPGH